MKLVVILGNSAVGKMTVGQELAKTTNLKLFHNHMIIEPVLEIFDEFNQGAITKLREVVFNEFLKTSNEGMIFTLMMAFNRQEDWDYLKSITYLFDKTNENIYYVELVASESVRLLRNKTENRLLNKKSKRDIESSEQRMIKDNSNHRLESFDGEVTFKNYLKINNTNIEASEVAKMIKDKFKL